MYENNKFIN